VISGTKKPAEIPDRLPLRFEHLARLNRPPFDANGNAASSKGNLLKRKDTSRRRVLAATSAAFLTVDKVCRRSNAASSRERATFLGRWNSVNGREADAVAPATQARPPSWTAAPTACLRLSAPRGSR
jgi:hypothetical protein